MLPTVTVQQLKEAMPKFNALVGRLVHLSPEQLPSRELRIRCAIADFILNSQEGTLEDRVYGLVSGMPLDVGTILPPHNGKRRN